MKAKFQIVSKAKIFGIISILFCLTGLVALIALPFGYNFFNMDIDFIGGTEMEFNLHQQVTQEVADEVAALFEETTEVEPSSVTSAGSSDEQVVIRSLSIPSEQRAAVITAMQEKYSITDEDLYANEDVSPSVGSDLKKAAILSAVVAVLLMLLYISFRFEFTSGLAAVTCLVQDLLVMVSAYVILQIPLNANFIAVALTIMGYSINASIIVFDRIRENLRSARKETFAEIAERSVWQTMGRTINTSLTTLFTVGALFLFGVTSLREFTLPLIIGIFAGGYSSIFLSSSLWNGYRKLFRRKKA